MSLPSPPFLDFSPIPPASAHLVHLKVSDVHLVEKGPDVSLHIPDPPPPAADPPLAEAARHPQQVLAHHAEPLQLHHGACDHVLRCELVQFRAGPI